ncbi:hypothetical protein BC628DRAFT_1363333 [Trametes gibbosa]|nr:hypothetical protein BC628DRAFT_1402700 [Trametes gibbosa]KAI0828583.1 hypothetical protein BC628DRAFT_1363333 [Trametes gibbosa]
MKPVSGRTVDDPRSQVSGLRPRKHDASDRQPPAFANFGHSCAWTPSYIGYREKKMCEPTRGGHQTINIADGRNWVKKSTEEG